MHKLAIFTGSDMKTFGGGEKYVIEFINRLPEFDTTIFSYHGKPPFRMTLNKISKNGQCRYILLFGSGDSFVEGASDVDN